MATTRSTTSKARKPQAHFSLVQAEKEYTGGLDEVDPFTVELKDGEVVTFKDPRTLGWQAAAALDMSNPYALIRELVEEDDYEKFVNQDFPFPILRQLGEAWQDHYGVKDLAGN